MKELELTSGVSTEETQQLITGRLLDLEWEPQNVQMVIRDNECIFLVGNEGKIVSTEHVSNPSTVGPRLSGYSVNRMALEWCT